MMRRNFNNRKALKIAILAITLIVFGIAVVVIVLQQKQLQDNAKLFNDIDQDYSRLDQSLTSVLGNQVDYDQSTECYYWKRAEFSLSDSNGTLGCFKSRAYYFQVQNKQDALNLEIKVASIVNSTFTNVQDSGSSISPPIILSASFYTTNTGINSPSIPGACFFTISFPPRNPPMMDLPTRHSNQNLMLVTSCGGDATQQYYQFVNR